MTILDYIQCTQILDTSRHMQNLCVPPHIERGLGTRLHTNAHTHSPALYFKNQLGPVLTDLHYFIYILYCTPFIVLCSMMQAAVVLFLLIDASSSISFDQIHSIMIIFQQVRTSLMHQLCFEIFPCVHEGCFGSSVYLMYIIFIASLFI